MTTPPAPSDPTLPSAGFPPDLSGLSANDWLLRLRDLGEARGFAEPLGAAHAAVFVDEGDTLLVSFETIPGIEALSPTRTPLGFDMVSAQGWSSLTVMAHGDTWFRDAHVIRFFDNLQEDGFFDDFARVVFFGAGPCGYAAAAFSAACPGARVMALQPQATLDPRLTEWDSRFAHMRRHDFGGKYGYAPAVLAKAQAVHVLYDPREPLDAMHAALFGANGAQLLRLPSLGSELQSALRDMGLWAPLLQAVAEDSLTPARFAALFRARRSYSPYLRRLLAHIDQAERPGLALMLCRNVTARMNAPRLRRRMNALQAELDKRGTRADT